MVAMDPNDPESVELASAVIRQHADMLGASFRNAIYVSWLRLKDIDAVESRYREFVDSALRDFRGDPDEYMLSIDMGRPTRSEQLVDDSGSDDTLEEQQIRIGVYVFWIGLAPQRRNNDTLESEIRNVVDHALKALRDDPNAFGSEFHWTSP
ncbi:hypothetical protein Poly51_11650 [Rubripirellula tenax]|uniref:Uncharacterized protein n=1 Tax=Rubripirellula tenax TaxID=2528015 RepID=A0A5C6FJX9_9BACT|nr:hypothetical protein [Rubripirellula tenax]TWU60883.1 hypothetical protein Poly51_11650 [Rubripirellula tenax]